jgi:predicted DNA-binding transcriptional regulator YafY
VKTNRLLEITLILLNKSIVTAKELAARFEVSTRTIYQDIDELSAAGVPVYTNKGRGGGISLL